MVLSQLYLATISATTVHSTISKLYWCDLYFAQELQRVTCFKTTYPPGNDHISPTRVGRFEDDFPCPKVGYVSFLEGTYPTEPPSIVFWKDLPNSASSRGWIWCPLIRFIHWRCQRNLVGLRLFDGWPWTNSWRYRDVMAGQPTPPKVPPPEIRA